MRFYAILCDLQYILIFFPRLVGWKIMILITNLQAYIQLFNNTQNNDNYKDANSAEIFKQNIFIRNIMICIQIIKGTLRN